MQLEGTVFACLVVQIKPQMEKLLKLPDDALTKEVKLTRQLQELFMEYQIPSDLVSYAGPEDAPQADKLAAVKAHVKALYEMLEEAKKTEIHGRRQEVAYAQPEMGFSPNLFGVS